MTTTMNAQRDNNSKLVSRRVNKSTDRVLITHYHKFCTQEAWTPPINLYEDDRQYVVIADLAGVKCDSIDIRVDETGVLALSGARDIPETPAPAGRVKLHLMEIDHGLFCRSLELPDDANIQAIPDAIYKCGLLYVSIPKKIMAVHGRTVKKVPGLDGLKHR
jgi:HSP20 family molecular chaperone IbpA